MSIKALLLLSGLIFFGSLPAIARDDPEETQDFTKLDVLPKLIKAVNPVYPYDQSRAGLTGSVLVEFIIDTTGQVRNPHIIRSNNPAFERPALDAISQWKFSPGRKDGRPVNVRAGQPINFELEGMGGTEMWRVRKGKDHAKLPPELRWETAPEPINTAFPVYPFEALVAGTKGSTVLSFVIGPNGRVIKADVKATNQEMGLAVLAMIDAWQFTPARLADGKPVAAGVTIEHRFDPYGRGDAPVSDPAREILQLLKKHPEEIIAAGQLDRRPKPVSRRAPVYPLALEIAGQPGGAVIEFFIDKAGDAQLPHIVSSTAPEFGYAAVQAVAAWRFEPPSKNGKAVVTQVRIPIDFELKAPVSTTKPKP